MRLGGHVTSVRLEKAYWGILEEIAVAQEMPLARFLTTLHDEVLELDGEMQNFASLLRCACLTYVEQIQGNATQQDALRAEARRSVA